MTGGAGGLAAGVAAALASDGFERVTITYRATPPEATVAAIEAAGASGSAERIDFLQDAAELDAALAAVVRLHGPFDTLVHAVGPLVASLLHLAWRGVPVLAFGR